MAATIRSLTRHRQPSAARLALVLCLLLAPDSQAAWRWQGNGSKEAQVKAAYIYRFISYIEWPTGAFADENTALVIGSTAADQVSRNLALIAKQIKSPKGRRLEFRQIETPQQLSACHIAYIPGELPPPLAAVFEGKAPVLLVGDSSGYLQAGGVVRFVIVDRKVRLQISLKSARQHGLKISSNLSRVAEVVD